MLKRGRADQALIQLRNALNLTAAKNNSGIAATTSSAIFICARANTRSRSTIIKKALDGFLAFDAKKQRLMRWSGWATTSSTLT